MSNNPFMDYQQQFYKTWTENLSKIPGMEAYKNMADAMAPGMENYMKFWSDMANGQNNPWASYMNMMSGMTQNPWESFMKMMPDMSQNPWSGFMKTMTDMSQNPFMKMMPNFSQYKIPGMDMYSKMLSMWQGMSDPMSFAKDFPEKYMDLMQDVFGMFLPDTAQGFMQKPMQLMDTCVNFYKQTMEPWMQIDKGILDRISAGDMTAYIDFFKEMNEKYDETFSKYFNMLGMGLNRESNEDYMKAMNAYNKCMFSAGEVMAQVMNSCSEGAKKMVEQFQANIAEGKSPTTFREFYDLWYNATEGQLVKLLETEEFAQSFDDFSDKYSRYLSAMNKVYERMLAGLPIPTNTDMKSLYKTVYDLRKDVRDLKRGLAKLQPAEKTGGEA